MQFNEFMQRLKKCGVDRDTRFLLAHMFEVQIEFSRHLDITTSLVANLVDKIAKVTQINDGMMAQLKELQRRGMVDGVDVHSVVNEPED